ncbi:hypothetical protein OIDMADRAFT_183357 [Oidiodendron maius Zn]|uniref:SnoaL-like domain-containing protein n=1 Tax=Oidiodendron maius (strain Zn) TaxID=913774 RepID=A0A0C3CAA5_OIDMZ|nr:hypothetical protein OIDMADRAFT_183357 [Oidiodendron maius Zn]
MEANIQDWFKAFYATSDDESAHAKYTSFFTPDAKLIMGDRTAKGQAEIFELRKRMWTEVSSRKHTYRYYSSTAFTDTYLLEGEVTYTFKAGGDNSINWVAKADFEGEGTARKLKFYQVFLNVGSK